MGDETTLTDVATDPVLAANPDEQVVVMTDPPDKTETGPVRSNGSEEPREAPHLLDDSGHPHE